MCYYLKFLMDRAEGIFRKKINLLLLLAFLFNSCNKKPSDSGDYSKAFKPIYTKTRGFFDAQKIPEGIYYIDSAFSTISNPTINDRFRYYGFHYTYSQKVKRNYKQALLYADSMLMLARQSVTREQYIYNFAEANYAKGDTYFALQQYNDAYQCYFQGYLLGKNYLHPGSLADYTYRMGMIMYKQAQHKLAANYFKESFQAKHTHKRRLFRILPQTGIIGQYCYKL